MVLLRLARRRALLTGRRPLPAVAAVLHVALSTIRHSRAQPGCEAKIRSVAESLGFCLMNDLDHIQELGVTTASAAALICENPSCSLRC